MLVEAEQITPWWRSTRRVKCLAQEHNVVPRQGLERRSFDQASSALIIIDHRSSHFHDTTLTYKAYVVIVFVVVDVVVSFVLFLLLFLLLSLSLYLSVGKLAKTFKNVKTNRSW